MTATYRLQLHAGFTFADARTRVPYLASLGVTHLYLSPILQAVAGSQHGYDVIDHTRVSDELGGEQGLLDLAGTAREHGMGLVVDVVPNHMAFVAPEHVNAPLWQVLRDGSSADTAHWFDTALEGGGGQRSLTGAVVGAVVISTIAEVLRQLEVGVGIGATTLAVPLGAQELGIAIVMLLILIFRPQGLMSGREIPSPFERGRRARVLATMREEAAKPAAPAGD